MKIFKLLALVTVLIGGYTASAQAALVDITIDESDCSLSLPTNCWNPAGPANIDADDVETITGTSADLTQYYKANFGGAEEGPFAPDYFTDWETDEGGDNPFGATITLETNNPIVCPECFLIVKGGNSDPSIYIFDLSMFGAGDANSMIETVTLTNFWDGTQGSISHVEIVGEVSVSAVPLPASIWLFGAALLGFAGIARRTKV